MEKQDKTATEQKQQETTHTAHHSNASTTSTSKPKSGMSALHMVAIVVVIVIIIGAVFYVISNSSGAQTVAAGDNVQVNYTGTFTNGTVFDSTHGRSPLNFTVGSGELIPGFDNAVVGMRIGQEKVVTLPPTEAYGEINPALIISVPKAAFRNQSVEVGMQVSGPGQSGEPVEGIVTAVNSTNATVDFNPPLAGQTLIFNITIVGIEKPKS